MREMVKKARQCLIWTRQVMWINKKNWRQGLQVNIYKMHEILIKPY